MFLVKKKKIGYFLIFFCTGFLDVTWETQCVSLAVVEMQRHAQVEGESANDDRKAQLREIQMFFYNLWFLFTAWSKPLDITEVWPGTEPMAMLFDTP